MHTGLVGHLEVDVGVEDLGLEQYLRRCKWVGVWYFDGQLKAAFRKGSAVGPLQPGLEDGTCKASTNRSSAILEPALIQALQADRFEPEGSRDMPRSAGALEISLSSCTLATSASANAVKHCQPQAQGTSSCTFARRFLEDMSVLAWRSKYPQ